jgi:hypothetical protein
MRTHLYPKAEHKSLLEYANEEPKFPEPVEPPPADKSGIETEDKSESPRRNRKSILEQFGADEPKKAEAAYVTQPSEGAVNGIATSQQVQEATKTRQAYYDTKPHVSEAIKKLRKSMIVTVEDRVNLLTHRANWLRDFSLRAHRDPQSIKKEEVDTLIEYIEEYKNKDGIHPPNLENLEKIDRLIVSLRITDPESSEGNKKYVRAALGFAGQYDRLAQRENLKAKGVSYEQIHEQTKREVTPMKVIQPQQPKKQGWFGKKIGGWFERVKTEFGVSQERMGRPDSFDRKK